MELFMTMIGILGCFGGTTMYFLYQRGLFSADDPKFYIINGVSAFVVMMSALYKFDGGDLGGVAQEFCWTAISAAGVYRVWRKKKLNERQTNA